MRLRIGSGFGIPVYLHWTFLLLPAWILLTRSADAEPDLMLVFTAVVLGFLCVVLHEFGHALMARRFGIETSDVTLYPIGGVARMVRMTDKPLEEFLIAIAGPAVNVVLAIGLVCVLAPLALVDRQMVVGTFPGKAACILLAWNIVMVVFNMLPVFPMDGGRVLRAFLSSALGHFQATKIAVGVSMAMSLVLGLVGILLLPNPVMLVIVLMFVFFAGQQELAAARILERRRRWEDEEPLEVLPVLPVRVLQPLDPIGPAPALMLQPKISVYTWDNHTGTWRKDAGQ